MKYINYFLMLFALTIWISVFSTNDSLHIIACDVGQGDAILITQKSYQILIDGGPNNRVIECLGKHMPVYDRTLELVISTHPQADHYMGLIEVFRRYKIENYMANELDSSNQSYQVLKKEVGSSGTNVIIPKKGMVVDIGLIRLDILNPEEGQKEINVNDIGVVTLLKYGEFEALFTADVENEVSDRLATIPEIQNIDYIKVNHHGSRNGMSYNLLKATMPKIAVISLGKNNRYKHPHEDILKMLQEKNIRVYRTDEIGDVDIETDGKEFWVN